MSFVTDLLQHADEAIRRHRLFGRGDSILIGVSGGVDSMVLLHILDELAARYRWRLAVAHLNHKLRGRSSDADERFVVREAARLKIPVVTESADVQQFAQKSKLSIEMAARKLRHDFFVRAARKMRCRKIALAHHADDQVELFLLRLLRGAGLEGLSGMKWRSPSPVDSKVIISRPLLATSRREIEAFARAQKITFRHDVSNDSLDILRNRIRHELLPLLEKRYQPAVRKVILRLMDIIDAESDLIADVAQQFARAARRLPFDEWPTAIQRRWLQRQLTEIGLSRDFELIEQLRRGADTPITVSPSQTVFRDSTGRLQTREISQTKFNPEQKKADLSIAGATQFGGLSIRWAIRAQRNSSIKPTRGREWFDADKVGPNIVLRHWRPGDRFQPIGMSGSVKLQDLFGNSKVPRQQRHGLVVAATGRGEIFWVEGLRISERFKLDATTRRRLEWRWLRAGSKDANFNANHGSEPV